MARLAANGVLYELETDEASPWLVASLCALSLGALACERLGKRKPRAMACVSGGGQWLLGGVWLGIKC